MKKSERRAALIRWLEEFPFATDEQLAEQFHVSVATIRLDRATLYIPEARERIRRVAAAHRDAVRALEQQEIVGDVSELALNRYGVSVLQIEAEHVFARSGIARGHHLFAQVNSLTVAVMDADSALTAKTQLRFHRPVRLGEVLRARVDVLAQQGGVAKCRVHTVAQGETVLDGFIWVATETQGFQTDMESDYWIGVGRG